MKLQSLLLCCVCGFAADVSGPWTGTLSGPTYLILKQEGAKLSGSGGPSVKDQYITFENGRVEGDRVIFRVGPFSLDLTLEGDKLTGEAKDGERTIKVYFKRPVQRPAGAPLPGFEVASVKQAPPPGLSVNSSMGVSPGRLTCTNVTIKKLMARAYGVRDYQIGGPDWTGSELYNIEARMPTDTTSEDLLAMVQQLLADRFKLTFHTEQREMPVYELVVGKTGSKLKSVEFGRGSSSMSPGKLEATAIPLRNFVETLSRLLNRPVLDKTGMTGVFDFVLEWSPEGRSTDGAGDLPVGPSLFTAIPEQLGLKLESRKAPIEILVIDRAEKVPTIN
jgi:uncharacterized protein (TIGR03435 family)